MRNIPAIVLFLTLAVSCFGQAQPLQAAFWNCENFFDTQHDTLKEDFAFTPAGENHWTPRRYADKRNKIYKLVAAMQYPAVMGLAEVENDGVLRDLCLGTPLRRFRYQFVHYESPDRRGVDCALIYRSDCFRVTESRAIYVSDTSNGFYTRDILFVGGILGKTDTCFFLVNHWPSKLGGATADRYRMNIARCLLHTMDSLQQAHPSALVLAMGDFNASPEEEAISTGLEFGHNQRNAQGFCNLMYDIPKGTGTYKYQDGWSCIDQMISNQRLKIEILKPEFMLKEDRRYLGMKLFRTYSGMKYLGGYSDHLPIIATLK